jgi:hypothetical protein
MASNGDFEVNAQDFIDANIAIASVLAEVRDDVTMEVLRRAYKVGYQLAPYDPTEDGETNLRDHLYIEVNNGVGEFGTKGCAYGAAQHFHDWYVNPSTPGTQPYFCSEPLEEEASDMALVTNLFEKYLYNKVQRRKQYQYAREVLGMSRSEAQAYRSGGYHKPGAK